MATVYVVRHADAEWSADEMGALTQRGRRDADRLADLLGEVAIDAIYSSPFPRAVDTVRPLAVRRGLRIDAREGLSERRLGDSMFPDFIAAVRATWDDFSFAHPGGETNAAAQQRIVAAVQPLLAQHQHGSFVIATHGNVLVLLLRHFLPTLGFDFWRQLSRPDVYCLGWDDAGEATIESLWRA